MPLRRLPALDFLLYANITFARNWNRVGVRGADPPLKKIIYLVKLPKHKPILSPTQTQLLHCPPPHSSWIKTIHQNGWLQRTLVHVIATTKIGRL